MSQDKPASPVTWAVDGRHGQGTSGSEYEVVTQPLPGGGVAAVVLGHAGDGIRVPLAAQLSASSPDVGLLQAAAERAEYLRLFLTGEVDDLDEEQRQAVLATALAMLDQAEDFLSVLPESHDGPLADPVLVQRAQERENFVSAARMRAEDLAARILPESPTIH